MPCSSKSNNDKKQTIKIHLPNRFHRWGTEWQCNHLWPTRNRFRCTRQSRYRCRSPDPCWNRCRRSCRACDWCSSWDLDCKTNRPNLRCNSTATVVGTIRAGSPGSECIGRTICLAIPICICAAEKGKEKREKRKGKYKIKIKSDNIWIELREMNRQSKHVRGSRK